LSIEDVDMAINILHELLATFTARLAGRKSCDLTPLLQRESK
jgi:hypothetical protein